MTGAACPACGDDRPASPMPARKGGERLACARCGTARQARPGAAVTDPGTFYGEDYFRGGVGAACGYRDYAGDDGVVRAQARARLRDLACRVPPPARLIEAGCATGVLLDEARALGYEVLGVEVSPWAASRARERLGDGAVINGRLEDAPIVPGTFDAALADDVLEHLPDPVAGLRALRKALKPGGLLGMQTPALGGLLHLVAGAGWFHLKEDHPVLFTARGLRLALARAGFAAARIVPSARRVDGAYLAARVGHWHPRAASGIAGALLAFPAARIPFPFPTGEMTAWARACRPLDAGDRPGDGPPGLPGGGPGR